MSAKFDYRLSPSQLTAASTWLPLDELTPDQFDKIMDAMREVASSAYMEGRTSHATESYMRNQLSSGKP